MFERLLFEAEVFIVMHITPGTESNKLKKKNSKKSEYNCENCVGITWYSVDKM